MRWWRPTEIVPPFAGSAVTSDTRRASTRGVVATSAALAWAAAINIAHRERMTVINRIAPGQTGPHAGRISGYIAEGSGDSEGVRPLMSRASRECEGKKGESSKHA